MTRSVRVGDLAPDGPLIIDGKPTTIGAVREDRKLLLIFLRHLM